MASWRHAWIWWSKLPVPAPFARLVLAQHKVGPSGTRIWNSAVKTWGNPPRCSDADNGAPERCNHEGFSHLDTCVFKNRATVSISSCFHSVSPPVLCRNWHRAMRSGIHQSVLLESEERYVPTARSTPEGNHRQRLRQDANILQLWIPGHAQDWPGEFYKDLLCQHWMKRQPVGMFFSVFFLVVRFSSAQVVFARNNWVNERVRFHFTLLQASSRVLI